MEFKIGQKLIISEAEFVIKAFSGDYALAGTTGANIANGGFFPIIIKEIINCTFISTTYYNNFIIIVI